MNREDAKPVNGDGFGTRKFTRGQLLKLGGMVAVGSTAAPLLSACGGNNSSGGKKDLKGSKVTVATVSNSQMEDMQKLSGDFTKQTGIKVKFLTLPENNLRQKITQDVAMNGGAFDLVMISNYETPFYAQNKWILSLEPFFSKMKSKEKNTYDLGDILKVWKTSLSYKNARYSLPFYGESSMLFYRKDLFKKAGLTMPDNPTWDQVTGFAKKLNSGNVHGIILRGQPGWGANMAPFDTFINTYGGRWYDMNWKPQLDSPEVKKAAESYSTLASKYGQPGITSDNFPECESAFSSGNGAMWYDATSASGYLADPKSSKVSDSVGFTHAPTAVTPKGSHWLYSWALGIESASKNPDAAFEFLKWATSKHYLDLVGKKLGWERVPPGTRTYSYKSTPYGKKPWANLELDSINNADPDHPTKDPVPYTGIQFVGIPEFTDLGDNVGRTLASLLAGKISVDQFAKQANQAALQTAKQGKYLKS